MSKPKRPQLLSDAIADYERWRVSMHIGKATIKNHRTTLNRLLAVNGNIYMHSIRDDHITRVFEEISRTKQQGSQINDYTALAKFFEWARMHGRMQRDYDPLYGRRKPQRSKRERERVHVSRFPALLDAAEARCKRDRMALALLLYTLGRDQEIANIRIHDVELDAGYIKVRVYKSNKEDRIPICTELDRELRSWLTYYATEVGPLDQFYFLCPSRDTTGVQGADGVFRSVMQARLVPTRKMSSLRSAAQPALEAIGFPVRTADGKGLFEGSHTIRRSGARALYERLVAMGHDGAIRIVQSLLHHASIVDTENYIGITFDRHTRDKLLRGQEMYAGLASVSELRREA